MHASKSTLKFVIGRLLADLLNATSKFPNANLEYPFKRAFLVTILMSVTGHSSKSLVQILFSTD